MRNIRKYIHESNLIEGFDSVKADQQSFDAWQWLTRQNKKPLTDAVICELQRRIVEHQNLDNKWVGTYRNRSRTRVTVGGKPTPEPILVPRLMENWLLDYKSLPPKQAHIRFEKIHPFVDGNGRTGRMLMWFQEEYLNGTEATLILSKDVADYYAWFE